jgi:hypothetical protein
MTASILAPHRFKKEAIAPFRLVGEIFKNAGRGDIVMLIAEFKNLSHALHRCLIPARRLAKHVTRRYTFFAVVFHMLMLRDSADCRTSVHTRYASPQDAREGGGGLARAISRLTEILSGAKWALFGRLPLSWVVL